MNNAQVVQQLRSRNRSISTWSIDVRLANSSACNSRTCEVKRRYIRPIGICFTLSKEENETCVTRRKFVDNARRDYSPITKREVVGAPKNFAKWWAIWRSFSAHPQPRA